MGEEKRMERVKMWEDEEKWRERSEKGREEGGEEKKGKKKECMKSVCWARKRREV